MKIINDKYFLTCISILMIILISVFLTSEETMEDNFNSDIRGIVYDVKQTLNGYTFSFQDTDGNFIKCYYKEMPKELTYCISGNYSKDGSIFFVKEMKLIQSE